MFQKLWLISLDLIASVFVTTIFCFWFIYLLEKIRQKWNSFKSAVRCSQRDTQQLVLAYNAKTELIKYIFLFFMNLVEWIAFICVRVASMYECLLTQGYNINHRQSQLENWHYNTSGNVQSIMFIILNIHMLGKNCIVLSIVLMVSLCMYLTARYVNVSWIKTDRICHLICIFVLYMVVNQIIVLFSSLIAKWFHTLLFTLSLIIAVQKVRKLTMIINWSIVDLGISQHNRTLLARHVKMKRSFNGIIYFLTLGAVLLILSEYIENISLTLEAFLSGNIRLITPSLLKDVIKIISATDYIICMMGTACIFVPYLGYGVYTFSDILWRLIRGKSGYKTHFSGHTF